MANDSKPDQVRWLEEHLGRRLFPLRRGKVTDWTNRKCYELNARGEIIGLNLARCSISDWSFLRSLPQLSTLDLSSNGISDCSFLQSLPQLTTLHLGNNNIRDGSFLRSLPQLTTLDLGFNGISDVGFLQSLPQLTTLDLWGNAISDCSFLRSLPQLTTLHLSDNGIHDCSFLQSLPQLTTLDLSDNGISDGSILQSLPQLTTLDLSSNRIRDWSFLRSLPQLTTLYLRNNAIRDCSFLRSLPQLTTLHLRNNAISDCSFLQSLPQLTSLDLGNNNIRDWSFLQSLLQLTTLDLSSNGIRDGSFLQSLPQLTLLNLRNNGIRDGSFLRSLPQLTTLDLGNNQIRDWSFLQGLLQLTTLHLSRGGIRDGSILRSLPQLTTLDLSYNKIRDWSFLRSLPQITSLDLKNNQIKAIDEDMLALGLEIEFTEYEFLHQSLNLGGNPIETPPREVLEQGDRGIRAWFAEQQLGTQPLNECKVILVGDGAAGKTTVRKRLMGIPPDPNESQTHGIAIDKHRIQCGDKEVLVHFWDFGGQEIMHATHQFFLSRRSLYIVVLDGRKDEDVDYWLKHIESFGGDSPILICLNKLDQNPSFEVNRRDLQQRYPSIQGFYRLKCLDDQNEELARLIQELPKHLLKVELAQATWPKRWFAVKQQLEHEDKPYIEVEEFHQTCRTKEITDETSQTTLIRYLNDLGVALHFEDERLNLLQILNPRWATQAVYRLLTAPRVAEAKGLLLLRDVKTILKKQDDSHYEYPVAKHRYLVDLMRRFELCYDVSENQVLFPDLLDVQEPNVDFPNSDVLRFHYEYDFLPKSILPRFIVRQHDDIDGKLCWRTGVVLRSKHWNARARIRAEKSSRRILIEVVGPQRRDYFAVLRSKIEAIHEQFTKLVFKRKVALPDHPDHAVDYEDLLYLEEQKQKFIFVGELKKKYEVQKLLDGIEPKERRQAKPRKGTGSRIIHAENYYEGNDMSVNQSIGDHNRNVAIAFGENITQTTAESIQNSFDRAREASKDELKDLLEQLAREVAKVVAAQKADDAEVTAHHLETATKQATAEKPSKSLWSLSKQGIIDAAQAVGAVGSVAIQLVKQIDQLL